jgi:hypothetical protein
MTASGPRPAAGGVGRNPNRPFPAAAGHWDS